MGGGVANGSVLSVEGGGATLEARAFARWGWVFAFTAAPNFVPNSSGVLWLE
jgi:hypothetical protein